MERPFNFEFHHPNTLSQEGDEYDRKEVYIQYLERKVEQYSSHSTRLGDELVTFCSETKEQTNSLQNEVLKKENEVRDLKEKLRDAEARAAAFSQRLDELAQTDNTNLGESEDDDTHVGPPEIARIYREEFYDITWRNTYLQLLRDTSLDESSIIILLKDIFLKCFMLCKNALRKQHEHVNKVLRHPGASVYILTSDVRSTPLTHSHNHLTRSQHMRNRKIKAEKQASCSMAKENFTLPDHSHCFHPSRSIKVDKTLASCLIGCQRNLAESDLSLLMQDAFRKCTRHALFRSCCKDNATKLSLSSKLKPHIQKAVLISWQMITQEPPMHINEDMDLRGNTKWDPTVFDIFEGYRGDVVKDVVLPEVYFFEGGMVAAKGVVRVEEPDDEDNMAIDLTSFY